MDMPLFPDADNGDDFYTSIRRSLAEGEGMTLEEFDLWKGGHSNLSAEDFKSQQASGALQPYEQQTSETLTPDQRLRAAIDRDGLSRDGVDPIDLSGTVGSNDPISRILSGQGQSTDIIESGGGSVPIETMAGTGVGVGGGVPLGGATTSVSTPEPIKQFGDWVEGGADQFGDYVSGLGEQGDTGNEAFNKIWPYKQQQLNSASDLFESGAPLVPDLSQDTEDYLSGIRNRVQTGDPLIDSAGTELSGLFGSTDPSTDFYGGLAGGDIGQDDPSKGFFQDTDYLGSNRAFDQLGKTSRGDYLNNNPYLDKIYEHGAGKLTDSFSDTMDKINSSYNLQGGFGSSARRDSLMGSAGDLTDSLGGLYNDIYGGNYQQERNRQVSSTNTLGNLSDTSMNRQMQGAGASSGIYNQGIDRRVQGASLGSGAYNQGFQNSLSTVDPSLQLGNQVYTDLDQLSRSGNVQNVQNTNLLMEPWQNIDLYGSAIGGTQSGAGTPQQAGNPLMGALGGAAAGSALGPWGALGGGLLGFFGSK